MLPENVMENEVLLKLVMDKLNTLSESQRKILYESAVNEKTDQVIASEFGMNPNTVKTTRRRAIQQFNKAMAGLADSRGLKPVFVQERRACNGARFCGFDLAAVPCFTAFG